MITVTRVFHFCAGHRLYRQDWSVETNQEVFGLCANPGGHGHNYVLELTLAGTLNPETGMIINLKELETLMKESVIQDIDHKNLNTDVAWLHGKIPTTEVLVTGLWEQIEKVIKRLQLPITLETVKVFETPKNIASISRNSSR